MLGSWGKPNRKSFDATVQTDGYAEKAGRDILCVLVNIPFILPPDVNV